MAYNGSGSYSAPAADFPAVASTLIESAKFNNVINDIATALSTVICKDGQTTVTANIPFGGYKLTGVGAATARTDAATLASIQDGTGVYVATVGGTADVITLTPSPVITAYAAGQLFYWIASGANTTNVTVAVSGLAAKAVTKNGTTALIAGDIPSGALIGARYDGTRFQLTTIGAATVPSGAATDSLVVHLAGTETVTGNKTFSGNNTHSGTLTMSGKSIWFAEGAAVASATTPSASPIWATDGNTIHITGTTTITGFADAPQAGAIKRLVFDGALILTNGANLICPGNANITTASGDSCIVYADATTQHRILDYTKATGTAVIQAVGVAKALALVLTVGASPAFTYQNNCASIVQDSTGVYTITFTTAFSTANFVTCPAIEEDINAVIKVTARSTSTVQITMAVASTGVATDAKFSIACFGA